MKENSLGKVGEITADVINKLNLPILPGTPIYIGRTNVEHMMKKHPEEYIKYAASLHEILSVPDYVGINPRDGSIEYVKDFFINDEYIKVAVRVANSGEYFARSLYSISKTKVQRFIFNGTLKCLTNGTE